VGRLAAAFGGFRLTPRVDTPPTDVHDLATQVVPRGSTYALMRATHPGRFVALVIGGDGHPSMVAKIATESHGAAILAREAEAVRTFAPFLPEGLRAPQLVDAHPGVVVFQAVPWRPRNWPWRLPEEVAAALGGLWRTGLVHGDCAPWNLLRTPAGWVLCDWETARTGGVPLEDPFHYLVQACALIGRPSRRVLLRGIRGEGWVGSAVHAFCKAAGLDGSVTAFFAEYLEKSLRQSNSAFPKDDRLIGTSRRLLEDLSEWADEGI